MRLGVKQTTMLWLGVAVATVATVSPWKSAAPASAAGAAVTAGAPPPFGVSLPFLPGVTFAPLWSARAVPAVPTVPTVPAVAAVRGLAWDWLIWEILMAAILVFGVRAMIEVGRMNWQQGVAMEGTGATNTTKGESALWLEPAEGTEAAGNSEGASEAASEAAEGAAERASRRRQPPVPV